MVHFKSESIDYERSTEKEFIEFISKHIGSTTSKELDEFIGLYDELKNKLKEFEGCEHDIIDRQKKYVDETTVSKIFEIFSFRREEKNENE